ncbi:MAG TPA: hypothetical protein EYP10_09430, partial [Armatimonadetes bacterium]|nr:hypothetical protein [Armatimonadota bacterium]
MTTSRLELAFGDVRNKRLQTPNDFVSHMVEHIAWRLGCAIDLQWPDEDWHLLGRTLGARIRAFTAFRQSAAALGMIDDGSAEVIVRLDAGRDLQIQAAAPVDRQWFLSLRCEQLASGRHLVDLLTGLCRGLDAEIIIRVCSFEDPHHTWEGIFRGVGMALGKLFTPPAGPVALPSTVEKPAAKGDVTVTARSASRAEVIRHTAESELTVAVDFENRRPLDFQVAGAPLDRHVATNAYGGLQDLLQLVAGNAGFSLQALFRSKALGSSHVLLEDTGMVLGKALGEILVKRMLAVGINGAGSSLQQSAGFDSQQITVGVSVEGRKFWRFVPLNTTYQTLQRRLIIGHTV